MIIKFILLYLYFFHQCEMTILGYEISDGKVCDIVVSKNRGTMIKFHAAVLDSNCKGLVRFKQENATYCIPIIDGKKDILHCPVSMSKGVIVIGQIINSTIFQAISEPKTSTRTTSTTTLTTSIHEDTSYIMTTSTSTSTTSITSTITTTSMTTTTIMITTTTSTSTTTTSTTTTTTTTTSITTTSTTTTTTTTSTLTARTMCPLSATNSIVIGYNGQPPPVWNFTDADRGNIYQSQNSAPSVAIGDFLFSDVDYEGSITVEQDNSIDHDFVGVVFSFQVKC